MTSHLSDRAGHLSLGAPLPAARGELTEQLFGQLRNLPTADIRIEGDVTTVAGDELQLALYCLYELHYRGFPDVDDGWEWEPSLLALRRLMEERFEKELRELVGPVSVGVGDVVAELERLATSGDGPSLSGWLEAHGTLEHVRELSRHRSSYQLKEADPHTWAIPRLGPAAKGPMVMIQADEYGEGSLEQMHSVLFSESMKALGLDPTPNVYLSEIPGSTLAATNLISLFGLHRRHRGALVGHLALFEMTSTGPMSRYVAALDRLDVSDAGKRFYEVHVEADEIHDRLAIAVLVPGLLGEEPDLAPDVVFGAKALQATEARIASELVSKWEKDETTSAWAPAFAEAGTPR